MSSATREVKRGLIAAASVAVGLTLATAPVGATNSTPEISVSEGECGEVTLSASWPKEIGKSADAVLVVQTVNGQQTANVGETITVGPFDYESDTIKYRVWGGEERAHDVPALSDLDALLAYLGQGGGRTPLDISAPGVAWHTLEVEGCPELTAVSPIEPTVTQFDCADDYYTGTITIPDAEGLLYEAAGGTRYLEPGTYTGATGVYTFVVTPQQGYVLEGGEESVIYEVAVEPVEACPEGTQPSGERATSGELAHAGAPAAPAVAGEPDYTG